MRIRVCIVIASILILLLFGYMLRKPTPPPEQMFDDLLGDGAQPNRKDLRERDPMSPRMVVRTDPLFQEFDD